MLPWPCPGGGPARHGQWIGGPISTCRPPSLPHLCEQKPVKVSSLCAWTSPLWGRKWLYSLVDACDGNQITSRAGRWRGHVNCMAGGGTAVLCWLYRAGDDGLAGVSKVQYRTAGGTAGQGLLGGGCAFHRMFGPLDHGWLVGTWSMRWWASALWQEGGGEWGV